MQAFWAMAVHWMGAPIALIRLVVFLVALLTAMGAWYVMTGEQPIALIRHAMSLYEGSHG